jgi:hypothetical protein
LPAAISADIRLARRQKAWFLPTALERGASGASAAISADIEHRPPAVIHGLKLPWAISAGVVFAGCVGAWRLRRVGYLLKERAARLPHAPGSFLIAA